MYRARKKFFLKRMVGEGRNRALGSDAYQGISGENHETNAIFAHLIAIFSPKIALVSH